MLYIYKVTNLHNNKIYIGCTNNIEKRHSAHLSDCFNPSSKRHHFTLYKAIRKYGIHNFKWDILGTCNSREELNVAEKICIEHFQSNNKIYGYNNTIGGDGGPVRLGMKHLQISIDKMKVAQANLVISDEQRIKTSNTLKGHKQTQESKDKKTKAHLGKPHPAYRTVLNITTQQIFNTPKDAAVHDNISYNSVIEICNGRQKQTHGHVYKYL